MKFKLFFLSIPFLLFQISCSKDSTKEDNSKLEDPIEIFNSEFTPTIIQHGKTIIDQAIDAAVSSDSNINLENIQNQIAALEGVQSVELSEKGTAAMIKEKNGAVLNLLIYSKADTRFIAEETIRSKFVNKSNILPPVVASSGNNPGRALILAPFQFEFNDDLGSLVSRFQEANYSTDIYVNEEADMDKFRGSFLTNYDIVYISTHGLDQTVLNETNQLGKSSSIATGQKAIKSEFLQLPIDERKETAVLGDHMAISPFWIELTADGNFTNTWVFLNACHGATFESGINSFSEAFFTLNAAAFNGFTDFIYSSLGEAIGEKAVVTFTSGKSFNEMSEIVSNDDGLTLLSTRLRNKPDNNPQFAYLDLFTSRKNITDPFYLVLSEELVGVASIDPESGPADTPAIFTVVINEQFVDKVTKVTFDIDNTSQNGLVMEKISDNTWEFTDLTAPDGEFPRIDTFAFKAFDEEDNVLGGGSAGFSFTKSASSGKIQNTLKILWTN